MCAGASTRTLLALSCIGCSVVGAVAVKPSSCCQVPGIICETSFRPSDLIFSRGEAVGQAKPLDIILSARALFGDLTLKCTVLVFRYHAQEGSFVFFVFFLPYDVLGFSAGGAACQRDRTAIGAI